MKNVLIFGDSYSTFQGELPEGHTTFYPRNDVLKKEQTWWSLFLNKTDSKLLYNDSWSGSTIGYTGYNNYDCSKTSSFICRYKKLKESGFFNGKRVDTIIVFGGTNDSWADAPLGQMKFDGWQEKDLFNVLPAICYFLYSIKEDFPCAEILCVINTDIKAEIMDCMEKNAMLYGLKVAKLHDIEKENGHPTAKGMTEICEQIISVL